MSNFPVFGTRLLPLAYHGLSPLLPPLLTHVPVPLLHPCGPSSAAPGHSLFLSLVCQTHSRNPCHHFLLSILCSDFTHRRGEQAVPWILEVDWVVPCSEEKQFDEKYKIPGLESIWFTQSCHMTPCYLPQCSLGCAISEKKRLTCVFRKCLFVNPNTACTESSRLTHRRV